MANQIQTENAVKAPPHLLLQIHFPPKSITTIGVDLKDVNLIGRSDAVDNYMPDIDLVPFGGLQNGVSRRHAKIIREADKLYLEDSHSTNGTKVNETELGKGQRHSLHDGDTIKLGQLAITVRFVYE